MWTQLLTFIIKLLLHIVELVIKKTSKPKKTEEPKESVHNTEDIPSQVELPKVNPIQEPVSTKPDLSKLKIIDNFLPLNSYVQDSKFVVNQIVLHHTAGGSAESTINYWMSDKQRVATHFIIDRDGTVYQCIPLEKSWGYHLYVGSPGNKIDTKYKKLGQKYDSQSVGIELCNYGYLNFVQGKFVNYVGKLIHSNRVINIPNYKGYSYWEDYTNEQIESLNLLLLKLLEEYPGIKQGLKQDYSLIGEIDKDALDMKPGIYSHVNYRTDKFDIYPNPKIIKMLNDLNSI